jgi:hypothetical protein
VALTLSTSELDFRQAQLSLLSGFPFKKRSAACREIAPQWRYDSRMFWTGFATGVAVSLAIGLAWYYVRERRQRLAFVASLSPAQREAFRDFEATNRGWRTFRDLLP